MKKRRRKLALLKLSGEVLGGKGLGGYSAEAMNFIGRHIATVDRLGVWAQAIVIGGGNHPRGPAIKKVLGLKDGSACDNAGMLATIANAAVFQEYLEEKFGLDVRVATAFRCDGAAEPHIRRRILRHLQKGRIVILAGGMGEPGFSTDTAMVRRGVELGADMILKGTKVQGVYTADPVNEPRKAKFLPQVSATEFLRRRLRIVDSTAVTMARDAEVSIHVFDVFKKGNYPKALRGSAIGSIIVP